MHEPTAQDSGGEALDETTFEDLCARHRAELLLHLRSMVRDPGAAEDLAQETFLRLWAARPTPAPRGVRAWLFRVATNLALNHLRSARRRPADPVDPEHLARAAGGATGWPAPGQTSPQLALEQAETAALCRQALAHLPAAQRELVAMVYEADLRLREIAEALGVPEGTVKSRLHTARQQLSRRWRELAPDWEDG